MLTACQFCGYEFDVRCGKYGCPNCLAEGEMICYQAIETKYLGPTNYRGTRIKATAAAGSLTFDYDHGLNLADNHEAAARALLAKLEWDQDLAELHQGALPSGNYCFIVEYRR